MRIKAVLMAFLCIPLAAEGGLLNAWEAAFQRDAQYQRAFAESDIGLEEEGIQRARLLPQISATASVGKATTETTRDGPIGVLTRVDRYDTMAWSIQFRQALWRPSAFSGFQQGKALVRAAEANLAAAKQSLTLRLIENLARLVEVESAYHLANQTAINQAKLSSQSAQLQRVGQMTRADVSSARAKLARANRDLLQAESVWRETQANWRLMVGDAFSEPNLDLRVIESIKSSTALKIDLILAEARESNPVLRALREEIEAAKYESQRLRRERLPTLDLYASVSFNDSDTDNTIGTGFDTTRYGVQTNLPIFSGGALTAQIRQADARVRVAQAELNRFLEQANVLAARELVQLEQAKAQMLLAKESLDSAKDQSRLVELGRKAGTTTLAEAVDAQLLLEQARHESVLATTQAVMVWARLHDLMGSLGDANVGLLATFVSFE